MNAAQRARIAIHFTKGRSRGHTGCPSGGAKRTRWPTAAAETPPTVTPARLRSFAAPSSRCSSSAVLCPSEAASSSSRLSSCACSIGRIARSAAIETRIRMRMAAALEKPQRVPMKVSRKRKTEIVVDASPGPPLVRSQAESKSLKVSIARMISAIRMTGFIIGRISRGRRARPREPADTDLARQDHRQGVVQRPVGLEDHEEDEARHRRDDHHRQEEGDREDPAAPELAHEEEGDQELEQTLH